MQSRNAKYSGGRTVYRNCGLLGRFVFGGLTIGDSDISLGVDRKIVGSTIPGSGKQTLPGTDHIYSYGNADDKNC